MITVNILSQGTDLEELQETIQTEVSEEKLESARELVSIIFVGVDELSTMEEQKVTELAEDGGLFLNDKENAVEEVNAIREVGRYNPELFGDIETILRYLLGGENSLVSHKSAVLSKQRVNEAEKTVNLEITLPV